MASKDPAVLFYIEKWLTSTAEMDSDVRGWYLNLILHQYDKGSLPNDTEKLASLACVKFSEFERFKQVFEQVLSAKFKQVQGDRLQNEQAADILKGREVFKDKREKSGTIGYIVKMLNTIEGLTSTRIEKVKEHLYSLPIDELEKYKNKQVLEQMLKQNGKLYINTNVNKDIVNKVKEDFLKNEECVAFCKRNKGASDEGAKKQMAMFWDMQDFSKKIEGRTAEDLASHFMNWISGRTLPQDCLVAETGAHIFTRPERKK